MSTKLIAALTFATAVAAATTALAGPTDGIRPGVSPGKWLPEKNTTETAPYALTGTTPKPTTHTMGWNRSVERLGNKVEVDRFQR